VKSSAGAANRSSKASWDRIREARLKAMIMKLLDSKSHGMTPAGMTKALRTDHPDLTSSMIRQAIRSLIEHGDLTYSERFGRTHVELNYCRVRRITDRITLSPPDCSPDIRPGEVLIKIYNGASFGMGDHPTTRIALRGVEYAMTKVLSVCESKRIRALDIGTGSGVLAIASIKLGATQAFGLDLDPVACHEARKNVLLNGLNFSVSIHETDLDRFRWEVCELLIANLRSPTLKQIIPTLHHYSSPAAFWVFTGFREAEVQGLKELLSRMPTNIIWQDSEHDWSGMVVAREDYYDSSRE
jgi:ribosomal protein L11 methyltransferase